MHPIECRTDTGTKVADSLDVVILRAGIQAADLEQREPLPQVARRGGALVRPRPAAVEADDQTVDLIIVAGVNAAEEILAAAGKIDRAARQTAQVRTDVILQYAVAVTNLGTKEK